MHIRRLRIQNIRSITNLNVEIPDPRAGWHVILGDNGSGKSSVIRAMALALMGPLDATATRQNWQDWIRKTASRARVELEVAPDAEFDKWKRTGRRAQKPITVTVTFPTAGTGANSAAPEIAGRFADRTIWGGGTGWFSASFGPFRRFSGGDKEYDRLFYSNPGLARHLSAFGEDVALGEALRWLQDLQFKRYENDAAAIRLLDHLVDFLRRSQLLPHGAHIKEITSGAVVFNDGAGVPLPVEQLSDGFRSVLSMTFELLRGMVVAYGDSTFLDALNAEAGAVNLPGVVAIDEIDAHMHPAWQKRIGDWLVERFPMVRFSSPRTVPSSAARPQRAPFGACRHREPERRPTGSRGRTATGSSTAAFWTRSTPPRRDGIVPGGTSERGVWSREPNQEALRLIVGGHMAVYSAMRV